MRTVLHVLPHPGGGGETYIDLLEALPGYRHERFPLSVTRSRRSGISSVLSRRRELKRLAADADLLHFHGDMAAMIAAPGLRGRPAVITGHGLHRLRRSGGLVGRVVRWRLRAAIAAADRTILNSHAERDDLVTELPAALRERLVVVHNGVPLPAPAEPAGRAELRRSLDLGEDEVAVLFVARLEARKDPLGAIAAIEAARAEGADLVLVVAGDGPLLEEVRGRTGAGVRALGHRDDLDDLYDATDLFLLPSHREGMSMALLEAMAHGLAPVVADGAGNAEAVADAGLVFAAGNSEAMAAALAALAADPAERARLGAAARARVAGELSVERFRERTAAQYAAALS
jgi:glycosyltransferase involved in cell wall biosynthesis